jgi:hypothetical protein
MDIIKQFNLVELKTLKNMNDNKFYKDNKNYIWQLFNNNMIELTKPNPETFTLIANLNNMNTAVYTVQPMILYKQPKVTVSPLFAEYNRVQTERTNKIIAIVNRYNLILLKSNIASPMNFYRDSNNMIWMVDTNYNNSNPSFIKPPPQDYHRIAVLNNINPSNYGIQNMVL